MFGPCCTGDFCCAGGSYCCANHPNKRHLHDVRDVEVIGMFIRLGNLSAAQLEAKTGLEFTDDEREELESARSGKAKLIGAEDWHAFDAPGVSITIGSANSRARQILEAANRRKKATIALPVYLDEEWKK